MLERSQLLSNAKLSLCSKRFGLGSPPSSQLRPPRVAGLRFVSRPAGSPPHHLVPRASRSDRGACDSFSFLPPLRAARRRRGVVLEMRELALGLWLLLALCACCRAHPSYPGSCNGPGDSLRHGKASAGAPEAAGYSLQARCRRLPLAHAAPCTAPDLSRQPRKLLPRPHTTLCRPIINWRQPKLPSPQVGSGANASALAPASSVQLTLQGSAAFKGFLLVSQTPGAAFAAIPPQARPSRRAGAASAPASRRCALSNAGAGAVHGPFRGQRIPKLRPCGQPWAAGGIRHRAPRLQPQDQRHGAPPPRPRAAEVRNGKP